MSANSMPAPSRGDRLTPTRPTGRGVSARESNARGLRQHAQPVAVQRHRSPAVAGPRRGQADQLLAQHPPPPPPRPDLDRSAGRRPGPATSPVGGCSATYGVGAIARATCSTSSPSCDRQPRGGALALVQPAVVEPRRRAPGASRDGAAVRGRPTRMNGAPSTITAGVPPTTAATTATAPTTTARASAGVGRQRAITVDHRVSSVDGRRHLRPARRRRCCGRWSASSRAPAGR